MLVIGTKLQGLKLIEPSVHEDHRGFFFESYSEEKFHEHGIEIKFIQDNHSLSVEAGVVRGLHYQISPRAQSKLVRVTAGAIYDVAADIRVGSPTYGNWQGFILSASNKRQLLIPSGFAHGFCTLVPGTEVQYKVDEFYAPKYDRGILWSDPALGIDWPVTSPILSEKDARLPYLADAENNFLFTKGE